MEVVQSFVFKGHSENIKAIRVQPVRHLAHPLKLCVITYAAQRTEVVWNSL
jgi:hypothetical protein